MERGSVNIAKDVREWQPRMLPAVQHDTLLQHNLVNNKQRQQQQQHQWTSDMRMPVGQDETGQLVAHIADCAIDTILNTSPAGPENKNLLRAKCC